MARVSGPTWRSTSSPASSAPARRSRYCAAAGARPAAPARAAPTPARLISAGTPIPVFGDGSTARDYTYINDILDGVMACTQKEFGYDIFNLGESQTVRLDQLIALLEDALGKKAVINRQPPQPGDVPLTCADIAKARAKLDYAPRVKIEQGIPLFVDWLARNPL